MFNNHAIFQFGQMLFSKKLAQRKKAHFLFQTTFYWQKNYSESDIGFLNTWRSRVAIMGPIFFQNMAAKVMTAFIYRLRRGSNLLELSGGHLLLTFEIKPGKDCDLAITTQNLFATAFRS